MVRPGEVPVNAFESANLANRKHGIWSRRTYEPISRELAEGLIEDRPDLANYPETVWSWARAEARCLLLAEWLADHPLVDSRGKPAPVSRFIVQFENQAMSLRAKLGLDPKSEAELASSRAQATLHTFDIEELRARGREVVALRGNS